MDFYRRIGLACSRIPKGRVATYGQISRLCGLDRHARQVGRALKYGLAGTVPAHRVVNHLGFLTGAPSFQSPDFQRLALEAEGVRVLDGRVDLKAYGWQTTMEEASELAGRFRELNI